MKSFASVFACAFFVFGMMAAPAWAIGDAPAPAVKEAAPAAEKKADPKCEGITLTGEKFLDMFYAIAMHGDLTDVPFIEKTLETKFEVKYHELSSQQNYNYKRAEYSTKTILGAPIEVSFSFDVARDPRIVNNFVGMLRINSGIKGFSVFECIGLTEQQIRNKFTGPNLAPDRNSGYIPLEGVGKDNSIVNIAYMYSSKNSMKYVTNLNIAQSKK